MGKKMRSSRTLNINYIMAAIVAIIAVWGIDVPAEVQSGVIIAVNWIMRLFTSEPIAKKEM